MNELTLHRLVVQLLERAAAPNVLWWHCPNGEHRDIRTAMKLKSMGVRAGVPDMHFVLADGRAAFMELKGDRGRMSDAQVTFRDICEMTGAPYAVVKSFEEAIDILRAWNVIHVRQATNESDGGSWRAIPDTPATGAAA